MKIKDTLLLEIRKKLASSNSKISFAESITGGNASAIFIKLPGASDYFASSIIAYNNIQKEYLLNVKHDTLEKYGAVSKQTALEMAKGIKAKSKSEVVISFTGNAGPITSENKEIGKTYITIIINEKIIELKYQSTKEERKKIIIDTINFALFNLNKLL